MSLSRFRSIIESAALDSVTELEIDRDASGPEQGVDDAAVRGIGYLEFVSYLARLRRFVARDLVRFDLVLEKSWLLSGLVSWLCRRHGIAAIPVENYVPLPAQGIRQDALASSRLALARQIAGYCLRRAPLVIAETDELRRSIESCWRVERDRIEVIGLGVDGSLFKPEDRQTAQLELKISGESTVLVYVGVLDRAHDLEPAIQALGRLDRAAISLHIVGDGPTRERLQELALPWSDRIFFHGRVPHDVVPRYIAAADLCLAPFSPGWFPAGKVAYSTLKIPEYLSAGRPVVTTGGGSIENLVDDGLNGFLIANETSEWQRLLQELPNRESLEKMGAAAARKSLRSWGQTAHAYRQAGERILRHTAIEG